MSQSSATEARLGPYSPSAPPQYGPYATESPLPAMVPSAPPGNVDDVEEDEDDAGAPNSFCCPITQAVMESPVIAADGFTYEESAIMNWFKRSNLSPMTGAEVRHKQVIHNQNLKTLIGEWREARASSKKKDE